MTSAEALGGLAPHYVFLYQRLSAEGDRRVRHGNRLGIVGFHMYKRGLPLLYVKGNRASCFEGNNIG